MSTSVIVTTVVAALGGILLKPTKDVLFTTLGIYRDVRPISEFPYTCRRITHPDLHACEDLWIDEVGRHLYAACSEPLSRKAWQPSVTRLNQTGRAKTDHFSVLSLDDPGSDGLFNLRTLKTPGFTGNQGDGVIDLHGFDAEPVGGSALRFYVVNHRPPLDPVTGKEIDATKVGANSTIEVFDHVRGSDKLDFVKTYHDPEIQTPNRVTATGENGFVMTNDKSFKTGYRRELDMVIGGGWLTHCLSGHCIRGNPSTLTYPNGLTRSHKDGLYYVPSSLDAYIYVFAMMPQGTLTQVDKIFVGQPMDNLAVDKNGDIFAATFPKATELFPGFEDPLNAKVPAGVFRISKNEGEGYTVRKVLEDRDAEVLPATTSVVHDVKTGRLFVGGVFAPYTVVCDPRK